MLRVPSEIKAEQFESLKIQDSTFVAYRSDVYPSKNDVFFEENAVIYVIEGDKIFSSPDQEVRVKKGDVLFIRRGYYLMSESINESYKSLVFFFDEKLLKEFVTQHLELFEDISSTPKDMSRLLTLSSNETFGKYVESLLPYFKSKTIYLNQFLKLKLQELLLHLLEFDQKNQLKILLFSIYAGQKTDLQYLINNYYLKPFNLNELARMSGRSLSAFKRDFQKEFGVSPGIWIKNKRLEHAAFLLKTRDANVMEVSEATGYSSVSHFIKAFKSHFGVTPNKL
ncbi:helix-turn-helix domain-containing protein [Emticicia sp. CRIBPO]|uniref:AraC family transcriptional regulator n=1 Tax=Emticicia sp. CRIBPO TaxID=2683258 RepID=UPI0014132A2D|nr:AraC family transcriptional regulator [Emticicia sp. CRIBPO]NBA85045.1 helix-turn-helix domain-containing protein [Emticicia sp. CRIBPO]